MSYGALVCPAENTIKFTPEEQKWIENHPVIHYGYEPDWPPYEIYENGEYKGIVSEYLRIVERETGITFEPIPDLTWESTLHLLKSGEINMVPCAGITEERRKYLLFTEPYISSPMIIITRKDYDFVSGLEDLKNRRIALPRSYYTAEMISSDYPDIEIVYKEGIYEALESVSVGEVDAFVGSLVVASYYIENEGLANLKVAAPTDYDKTRIGFAARKDWPELISIVQKVLDNVSTRERSEIYRKWILVRYEYGIDKYIIIKLVAGFAIVIALILIWNRTLRKEVRKRKQAERELKQSLQQIREQHEEKKALLREIHHRVKNNLHIVSGMLTLQGLEARDDRINTALKDAVKRVRSMALIHEKMYQTSDLENVNLEEYVRSLVEDILNSFANRDKVILNIDSDIANINTEVIGSLALILNELVTNTLKYGFKNRGGGVITIRFRQAKEASFMTYHDDGTWIAPSQGTSFGSSLIEIFTEQLEGTFELDTSEGTTYRFRFGNFAVIRPQPIG